MPDVKAVENVKKLESDLANAKESARSGFLQTINENIAQLGQIGFEYELVAKNGTAPKKAGRPRKEVANGSL